MTVSHVGEPALAQSGEQESVGTRLPTITVTAPTPSPERAPRRPRSTSNPAPPGAGEQAETGQSGVTGASRNIAASEATYSGQQVNARTFTRPGEALEIVPGLIVTQHSG